jgi:hypothetical protein
MVGVVTDFRLRSLRATCLLGRIASSTHGRSLATATRSSGDVIEGFQWLLMRDNAVELPTCGDTRTVRCGKNEVSTAVRAGKQEIRSA